MLRIPTVTSARLACLNRAHGWTAIGPGLRDALVILGAAGIVIPAFARLRISPVIGFILVGIIAGPSGLGAWSRDMPWLQALTITDRESIEPFAEFGIILLLFAIGLELSFRRLWAMRTRCSGSARPNSRWSPLLIGGRALCHGPRPCRARSCSALPWPCPPWRWFSLSSGCRPPVGRCGFRRCCCSRIWRWSH